MYFKDDHSKNAVCLFSNKKFMGIEFKYDCYLVWAGEKVPKFHVQITLGWVRFWWIRYK